ncbi:hypothetical protein [Thermoactinomyces mirandus]|uniref:Uncharacterized protein n=1 Tax=Thermoactinomyces mirandus TaxID=2756294 RepID=A0A7W1XR27_9BACL|nr:hypothetical protein [Thermoactinomyces mirandus]MBA4601480.1 hypothetical protein [Thermoactinomyces mirandus]
MSRKGPSLKDLTQMINSVMGQPVLSEKKMERIMQGAKKAHDQGGMDAVLEYLMKVTQADVEFGELKKFANQIQKNPRKGLDILQGKKQPPRKK